MAIMMRVRGIEYDGEVYWSSSDLIIWLLKTIDNGKLTDDQKSILRNTISELEKEREYV